MGKNADFFLGKMLFLVKNDKLHRMIENCHICDQDQEQHRADVGEADRGGCGQGPQAPGHRRRLHRLQGH